MRLGSLLDWWGRSYHTSERDVIEAALQYAGQRGTRPEGKMIFIDVHLWGHPGLRINRVLRVILRPRPTW